MRPLLSAAACAAFALLPCAVLADHAPAVTAAAGVGSGDALRLSQARPIPTEAASQPGPLHLDGCFSDGRGADGLTVVHHAVRMTNTGDRAISAVRLRFVFYDAFGDVNETRTNVAQVKLDPGATADRVNLSELSDAGPPSKIACSVDAVRYADGTVARTGASRG